jgi:beta-phosphoglucomutase
MGLKGVIFDLDGVIVDTVPLHFKAWKKMFAEYGKDFTFEDYKQKVDGIPRMDGARAILTDLPEDELKKAADKKQNYFLQFLEEEGVKVYQSTVDLINKLKSEGIKVAVISSSKNCLPILKRAGLVDLFDVMITGNDIKKGKPDPEIFLLAAEKLGLEPSECIVFEDALLGVEAAKNAGMICIGIDRYGKPERLKRADLVVSDVGEVSLEKLKELASK